MTLFVYTTGTCADDARKHSLTDDLQRFAERVENTQSRSAFDTDETDRRYGFDVLFRYEREDKRAVPAISKPPITFTKEE